MPSKREVRGETFEGEQQDDATRRVGCQPMMLEGLGMEPPWSIAVSIASVCDGTLAICKGGVLMIFGTVHTATTLDTAIAIQH